MRMNSTALAVRVSVVASSFLTPIPLFSFFLPIGPRARRRHA